MPKPIKKKTKKKLSTPRWMTLSQRETYHALVALSPGRSRPWVRLSAIVSRRCDDLNLGHNSRSLAQIMSWADSYLRRWESHFVERNKLGLWRFTTKGKRVALTGDL